MKCGTTALLRYLDHHPDIVSARYEIGFFDRQYEKGLEWYRNKMPLSSPGQLTVEKTPRYCMSNITASPILAMNSSIKAILLVRDPIVRSLSRWMHYCQGRPSNDTEEAKRVFHIDAFFRGMDVDCRSDAQYQRIQQPMPACHHLPGLSAHSHSPSVRPGACDPTAEIAISRAHPAHA